MAGSTQSGGDDDLIAGINVTPLVDVVLVLLIIFMITAPAIYQSAIKVQLPKAKSGEEASKNGYQFTLNKEGELTWNNQKTDLAALSKSLAAQGAEKLTNETAMISADEATPHGTVVKLMDTLRQAGLSHFGLSVDSR